MNILPMLIERFFTQRLVQQRDVSPHTIASYRDTFRMLLRYGQRELRKRPSDILLSDLDAPFVVAFLNDLEAERSIRAVTRNLRLTAVRTFFNFVAFEEPAYAGQVQRIMAIPGKITAKREVSFLDRQEIEAILDSPDRASWIGRRDFALLLLMAQTGLRLSEVISLQREDVSLGQGAHVRSTGKGRKARATPLTRMTRDALRDWLREPPRYGAAALFPNIHGGSLSPDAVQLLLSKHVATAAATCRSLLAKRISPHILRHSAAMALLGSGVEAAVISLWLGHESPHSTHAYLHAHLALKEAALAKVAPIGTPAGSRYCPDDRLLAFLGGL